MQNLRVENRRILMAFLALRQRRFAYSRQQPSIFAPSRQPFAHAPKKDRCKPGSFADRLCPSANRRANCFKAGLSEHSAEGRRRKIEEVRGSLIEFERDCAHGFTNVTMGVV